MRRGSGNGKAATLKRTAASLRAFMAQHGISQGDLSRGARLGRAGASNLLAAQRTPRTDTVNRILAYLRRFDSAASYEQFFGGRP